MLIQRELLNILRKHDYSDGKAVVIFGARRVGKTTILRTIVGDEDCTWIDGDAEGEAAMFRFSTTADARTFYTELRISSLMKLSTFLTLDECSRFSSIPMKCQTLRCVSL